MTIESLHAFVKGRVQGVGFRYFVLTCARQLTLNGYTRNLADGTVEVYAEGRRSDLDELLRELKQGPSHADVEEVEVRNGEARGQILGFYIR